MKLPLRFLPSLGCLLALSAVSALADGGGACDSAALLNNWPQWRGPLANGVSPQANPPIRWSETNNVRWKIPLPGKGHSSPVVFGDAVYVLAAMPVGEAQKPVYDDAPGVHDSTPVTHRHQFVAFAIIQNKIDLAISFITRQIVGIAAFVFDTFRLTFDATLHFPHQGSFHFFKHICKTERMKVKNYLIILNLTN